MARNYKEGDTPIPGYKLRKFLGRGGFGEVWRATAPGGFEVAIKIINLSGKPGQKELRALQVVKKLRHPNLVAVTAFWLRDEDGNVLPDPEEALARQTPAPRVQDTMIAPLDDLTSTPASLARPTELVICMGLADKSLFDRLQECQRQGLPGIPTDELMGYMDDAARAIDYLNSPIHSLLEGEPHAVQHCDIKPHNILIVSGAAQVCDFGLARVMGDVQNSSAAAGTIAYAAPECIKEGKPSPSTDQYSLAISYLELKTGALPYDSETWMEVLTAVQQGNLNLSKLPEAEQAVIRKATSTNPADRFATSMDMMRALHEATRTGTSLTTSVSPLAKTQPEIAGAGTGGGLPLGVIGAVAAVILLLAGGVGWYAWPRDTGKKVVTPEIKKTPDPNDTKKVVEPPKAETSKALAEKLKAAEDYGRAVDKYNEWLAENPSDMVAVFDRGVCHLRLQRLDEAIRDFEHAISLDTGKLGGMATKRQVGEAYLARGQFRRKGEDLDGALKDLTRAAEFPDLPPGEVLFAKGAILLAKKDFEAAVKDLEAARVAAPAHYQRAPELGQAYVGRGELRLKKSPQDGMADAQAALKIDDKNPMALLLRGTCHLELDELDAAKADFAGVLKISPMESRAFSRRGIVNLQQENYTEAINDFSFAIKIDEPNPHFVDLFNRGRAYLFQGKALDRAISDFERALMIEPKDAMAHFLLGESHRQNESPETALAEFRKAIELKSDLALAQLTAGIVCQSLMKYPESIEYFTTAIKLNAPSLDLAYDGRSIAYEKTEKKELAAADAAVAALLKKLDQTPEDVPTLTKVALMLAASPVDNVRQGAKARDLATKACQLTDMKDADALAALAAAEAELGKYDEAAKLAQQAVEAATDAGLKTRITAQLERYTAKQPWRLEKT